ncbi:general secretion pathway protein GspB [Vibrio sp. F74]|uniref:general secretion pathway protein GspB n=1 Tax=Vibrio sp. F74 TaxID=700020 RepID=UPI0035F57B46
MSELMKSLAQSEQGYKAIHTPSPVTAHQFSQPKRKNNLVLIISLILLPPVASIAYIGYNAEQSWQRQTEQAMRAFEEQQRLPKSPLVKFLAYPEFAELRTIEPPQESQVNKAKLVGHTSDEAKNSNNNVKPVSDDFQLESLDLSGLSSELAERVQDALNGDVSSQLPSSNDSPNDVEKIELVDYEYVFEGKLPAMNLQTHMYAGNVQHRWVKINGVELYEGDWISAAVQLLTITPRYITVGFDGDVIEIPALYEWQG